MASLEQLADELERSYAELQERMSDPSVYADRREAAELGRRLKELEPAVRASRDWRQASADLAEAKEDPELASMASELEADVARLEDELRLALVERDPADGKDVIVEVRQGVGGDEAALWAGEVARMLQRYAERRGFRTETLSGSENEGGGVKEAVFAVKGDGAFSVFKWEGGTHRVQRVPTTESQGRIHTSTATVAVMPEAEDVLERLAVRPAPDERARVVELGDRQRPVEVHVQLDAVEPEGVREEPLGFEARPPGAPCREMVGRPPEDLSDGHITRLPRVPAGGPPPGASR